MRIAAVTLLAGAALVLAGCVPSGPHATSPSPSATSIFASDEEALAAAEKAYAAYLQVSDQILADGGNNPERLRPLVTQTVYSDELAGYKEFVQNGWHGVGQTTFYNFSLQSYAGSDPNSIVSAYVCSDLSGTDVVDASGKSVVAANRPSKSPFEVQFALARRALVVSSTNAWTGGGIC